MNISECGSISKAALMAKAGLSYVIKQRVINHKRMISRLLVINIFFNRVQIDEKNVCLFVTKEDKEYLK